jgi:transcriptional regulator with XRE-family HTH domain
VTETRSPTVRRRELGALLRALRVDAGLTVEQVADRLLCSPSKVSRMETGQRGASARDVRDLCEIYGIQDPARRDHLATLAREGRGSAWWQPFDLPYATYVGLEAEAVSISEFGLGVVPGLLQTPAYARALHESAVPKISQRVVEQRIEVRHTRQKLLSGDAPPQLAAVIDEAVLHRVVGSPAVMRDQLQRLIDAQRQPSVTVRVIPFRAGPHMALNSPFILLEFAFPVSAVVYVEGLIGQMYLERPPEVQRYKDIFEYLRGISLTSEETASLMTEMISLYDAQR